MKIGFITPEYPSNYFKGSYGGIATFTKRLATELVRANHKIFVFIHSQNFQKIVKEEGVELHFIKQKKVKGLTWYVNRRYSNNYINRIIESEGIQVVEAPEWTGFTAFMKFKCTLVLRLHGSDTYFCNLENRRVKPKNKFFEKRALLGADSIVGVSHFVANETKALFKLKQEIEVIHNAINPNEFIPNHDKIVPKRLLYFGTVIRKKGVLELAKVFNLLVEKDSRITLQILGKDTIDLITGKSTIDILKSELSNDALKNFEVISEVPYKKVHEYIRNAQVVVLPSLAEACPMAWLEAMALEKALLTSNIGWSKEIMIDGKTGFTVNPYNQNEFLNKISELLENKNLRISFGKNARKQINSLFTLSDAIEKNVAHYDSIKFICKKVED